MMESKPPTVLWGLPQEQRFGMLDSIQLGNFTVNLEKQRLLHLGQAVSLRPKTWLVLRYMARRLGTFLSTDELQDSARPGLAVTPQTLTNVISELRKVSRLDGQASMRIETRYGEGYRLVVDAPAQESMQRDATAVADTTAFAMDLAAETRPGRPFVTRLVLDSLSRDSVHAYLAQRFHDSALTPRLTTALEEKSGGNPLFLGELVDAVVERGWAV